MDPNGDWRVRDEAEIENGQIIEQLEQDLMAPAEEEESLESSSCQGDPAADSDASNSDASGHESKSESIGLVHTVDEAEDDDDGTFLAWVKRNSKFRLDHLQMDEIVDHFHNNPNIGCNDYTLKWIARTYADHGG